MNLREEPVSFIFTATQAQLAEFPGLPSVVKLDAEMTVRLTTSDITSDPSNRDAEEEQAEADEIEK